MRGVMLIVLGLVLLSSIESQKGDDWPMFLHDPQHTSFSKDPAPETPFLLWISTFDTKLKIYSSPVIKNGNVYFGDEFGILSLNADNGSILWEQKENAIDSTMAISNHRVFVGTQKKIIALNSENGDLIWKYVVAGRFIEYDYTIFELFGITISSPPIVHEGNVYIGTGTLAMYHPNPEPKFRNEYYLLCLDEETGKEKWYLLTGNDVKSSPALYDNYIFVLSGKLYSINAKNGKTKWTFGKAGFALSSPTIIDGRVLTNFMFGDIFSRQSKIVALDVYTGRELWSFHNEYELYSSFGTGYSRIFINSRDGKIYALDEFTGEKIWEYRIAVNSEEFIYEHNFWFSPAVADGKVFVGSVDGNFYCLDAETGKLIWKYKTGGPIYSSPAISEGKVFIASTDGKLYAFGIDPETYFSKAEKYFSERQFKRAKEFYLKAKEYYASKDNIEMIRTIDDKIVFTEQKIIEDNPRQDDLTKAQELIEKGSSNLANEEFKDALTYFKEAKTVYEKNGEKYKIRLCEDRINYTERRIKEQTTRGIIILGAILLILIAGFLIIRRLRKKITT